MVLFSGSASGSRLAAMAKQIGDAGYGSPYRLRKQIVEPVFGQIRQARGFRQFLLRGLEKVKEEWVCCSARSIICSSLLLMAER